MTELVQDNLNPEFVTEVVIDYFFESQQTLLVEVYDADDATNITKLQNQDFVGYHKFVLGSLISSRNQEITAPLLSKERQNNGTVTVMASEKKDDHGKMLASFQPRVKINVQNSSFVFFIISRMKSKGNY
jgi:hypothetical protein